MKRLILLFCALLIGLAAVTSDAAKPHVLAIVNGRAITAADVIRAVPKAANDRTLLMASLRRYINTVLIYQDAVRLHLARQARARGIPPSQTQGWMIHEAERHWLSRHPITPQDLRARYARLLRQRPPDQWRLRVIVALGRHDALQVIAKLRRGANFSVLAAEHPQSPNAQLGGEMGWVNPQRLAPALHKAVAGLKPLEIVGPVVVPKGLAIVQLLARRKTPKPRLSAVQKTLRADLIAQRLGQYASHLRRQAKIVYPQGPSAG